MLVGACLGTADAARQQASVLLLLPGKPGQPAGTAIAAAIRDVLHTEWAFRVSIEMEHVDVARFPSPDVEEHRLRALYGSKYAAQRFDVIVAALPEPFEFVLRARDELWPATPVVVCGLDERNVRDLKPPPGFTVLTTRFDMEGTVSVARTLLPDTRRVALVGGASAPEQRYHELIRQAVQGVGLDVIDLTKLPLADVLARVSHLPEHTVVVQSSYQVDGEGRRFFGIDLVPHISKAANRPVFTPLGLALGRGVVGGSIIEFEDMGRDAAMVVSQLLRGDGPPATPVLARARSVPRFDGRQLARWNLDESRLPPQSEIIFPRPTPWREYRWHVAGAIGLIGVELTLIITLLVQRRRRREAQAVLAERLRFEALVSDVVSACATVTVDQLDARTRDCLRRIVTFLGVDRGGLWQRSQDPLVVSVTHVWQRAAAATLPMAFDLSSVAYFRERMDAGQAVCVATPDELPLEATAERAALQEAGVRSFAAIPLFDGDRPLGFLAFVSMQSERQWPRPVVQQLQVLAEHFSTVLIRMRSAAVVESSLATADAILAALPGETAIIDSAGTIVQTNDAWATAARNLGGAQLALVVGASYLDACQSAIGMAPDVGRTVYTSIRAVLSGERTEFVLEYPTSRRGEDRWFEVRVRRLARLGGGAAVMHFDVTARRQAEAAAQRHLGHIAHLDRVASMGQLASSIAHELNQPLTAILANAQTADRLLARPQPDLEELRACVADVISDDRRAAEVIRRMRRMLTKTDFVSTPVALNDLAATTLGLVTNEALLHAVTIDFLPAPVLPVASGDTVQIQQVILNLLTNAIHATANAGALVRRVTVWTAVAAEPYIELGVRDSGKGIPEGELGRIFEPFFTTKSDGLGMGLAISRTIVEAHGGRLLVENDPAGGAIFLVHLRTDRARAN